MLFKIYIGVCIVLSPVLFIIGVIAACGDAIVDAKYKMKKPFISLLLVAIIILLFYATC